MKLKRIVLAGMCSFAFSMGALLPSNGACQQAPAAERKDVPDVRQAAPQSGAEAKTETASKPADGSAKAQTPASPEAKKADQRPMGNFDATEGCAGS
ncbi:MAG: hypothetical protein LLG06_04975 [Desulfobacteraceae bacterium]|nr:hypothetical protein [Desulfobacteraceae bacterium]